MHTCRSARSACALALVIAGALPTRAQTQRTWHVVGGVGPFLSRDRGWNFDDNIAASLGVSVALPSSFTLRALATIRASRTSGINASTYSLGPSSVTKGAAVSLQILMAPGPLGLYCLGGIDYFRAHPSDLPQPGAPAASLGLGVAWGARHAWALESRFARYSRALGATHGHLDLAFLRSF